MDRAAAQPVAEPGGVGITAVRADSIGISRSGTDLLSQCEPVAEDGLGVIVAAHRWLR
jgi:hypothetical protein